MIDPPVLVLARAICHDLAVVIETRDGTVYAGRPLHQGPNSLWLVVGGHDVFVKYADIDTVKTVAVNPEGA